MLIISSTERVADELIKEAVEQGASDIHLSPKQKKYVADFRIHGTLYPARFFSMDEGERLVAHFKYMGGMDIGEKRKPQNGAYQVYLHSTHLSLRLSTLPTSSSKESLVIRLLLSSSSQTTFHLSLFPSSARKLYALMHHAHGLIIFTGPTGSGKTTTLYHLIHYCSQSLHRHVITLEDPIEKENENALQVQVNEKAGVTYATGLKAILRHDPDVIMVGEIRDTETAKIAIRAALTGHLVLTTMHTKDAKGAIYRLLEFGVKWNEIQQTLLAVSAQRLVKLNCPYCHGIDEPSCPKKKFHVRSPVYELLTGKALQSVLKEAAGEGKAYHYPLLKDLLRKGVALGFISNIEYARWFQEE